MVRLENRLIHYRSLALISSFLSALDVEARSQNASRKTKGDCSNLQDAQVVFRQSRLGSTELADGVPASFLWNTRLPRMCSHRSRVGLQSIMSLFLKPARVGFEIVTIILIIQLLVRGIFTAQVSYINKQGNAGKTKRSRRTAQIIRRLTVNITPASMKPSSHSSCKQ